MVPARPLALATIALTMAVALAGCASAPSGAARALAPRPAEAIDPRAPIVAATTPQPADPALAARLAELTGRAHQAEAAFATAAAQAERLTAAAGPPQSESWVVAQQALSAVVAAREPAARALGDIDAVAQAQLSERGGIAPADLAAIEAAAADVGALDRRQAERIDALQARLGG